MKLARHLFRRFLQWLFTFQITSPSLLPSFGILVDFVSVSNISTTFLSLPIRFAKIPSDLRSAASLSDTIILSTKNTYDTT
jgi:hypothetical protein